MVTISVFKGKIILSIGKQHKNEKWSKPAGLFSSALWTFAFDGRPIMGPLANTIKMRNAPNLQWFGIPSGRFHLSSLHEPPALLNPKSQLRFSPTPLENQIEASIWKSQKGTHYSRKDHHHVIWKVFISIWKTKYKMCCRASCPLLSPTMALSCWMPPPPSTPHPPTPCHRGQKEIRRWKRILSDRIIRILSVPVLWVKW